MVVSFQMAINTPRINLIPFTSGADNKGSSPDQT